MTPDTKPPTAKRLLKDLPMERVLTSGQHFWHEGSRFAFLSEVRWGSPIGEAVIRYAIPAEAALTPGVPKELPVRAFITVGTEVPKGQTP